MMKRIFLLMVCVVMVLPAVAQAKTDYIYRSRLNWVKTLKLSKKQLGNVKLNHPDRLISTDQMEAMLGSLQMNKASLLKSEIKTSEIFTPEEARKYAPLVVKALKQVEPNEVVNLSIVHKRPDLVLRSDYLSMLNVYVSDEGVHFYFGKLFAKLSGDYKDASRMYEAIGDAKNLRVSLKAGPGQRMSYGQEYELILDPTYNFVGGANNQALAKSTPGAAEAAPASNIIEDRLQRLDELKAKGLISDKEYKAKRQQILNDL